MKCRIFLTLAALLICLAGRSASAQDAWDAAPMSYLHKVVTVPMQTASTTVTIPVNSDDVSALNVQSSHKGLQVSLESPSGVVIQHGATGPGVAESWSAPENYTDASVPGRVYMFLLEGPEIGNWQLHISAGSLAADLEIAIEHLTADAPFTVVAAARGQTYVNGQKSFYFACLDGNGNAIPGVSVTAQVYQHNVTPPAPIAVVLEDGGQNGDDVTGDGIFTVVYTPTLAGPHSMIVNVSGTHMGAAFERSGIVGFEVRQGSVQLLPPATQQLQDTNGNMRYEWLHVTHHVTSSLPAGLYECFTRVDGPGGQGMVAQATLSLHPGSNDLPFSFAAAHLRHALSPVGPYEITALWIEEPGGDSIAHFQLSEPVAGLLSVNDLEPGTFYVGATSHTDCDSDGLSDGLNVAIQLKGVPSNTWYHYSFDLVDKHGHVIETITGTDDDLGAAIPLQFSGSRIGANGVDGPYSIRNAFLNGVPSFVESFVGVVELNTPVSSFERLLVDEANEGFDGMTVGTIHGVSGWIVHPPEYSAGAEVAVHPTIGTNTLSITSDTSLPPGEPWWVKSPPIGTSLATSSVVEVSLLATATSIEAPITTVRLYDPDHTVSTPIVQIDPQRGAIQVAAPAGWIDVAPFYPDTEVELRCQISAGRTRLFVDGDQAYSGPGGGARRSHVLFIVENADDDQAELLIDDISIAGFHDSLDINGNGIDDSCDIAAGQLTDCDGDGIADGAEGDCDGNQTADAVEICLNPSLDSNLNGVLDVCEPDCNGNDVPDSMEILPDCNGNGVPDDCDPWSIDCDGVGGPDDCQLAQGLLTDLNGNLVADTCDIVSGVLNDCNGNMIPDEYETFDDCNNNGIPDDCEADACFTRGDCNGDGFGNIADPVFILGVLFPSGCTPGVNCPQPACRDACDANDDGGLDISDAVQMLSVMFPVACTPGIDCPVFAAPFPGCGGDPTDDTLNCGSYTMCP